MSKSTRLICSINQFLPIRFCYFSSMTSSLKDARGGLNIDDIPTWEQYFKAKSDSLKEKKGAVKVSSDESYPVCDDLNKRVSIFSGDITNLQLDAIVNAANKKLLGGGGVDGAIHRKAGPNLLKECRELNGCETGEAKVTLGYNLPAKNIIHTVGPVGEKPDLLAKCYNNSLQLALDKDIRTIAFPCISTGIYGYPQAKAATVALKVVRKFLETNPTAMDRVIFCLFLKEDIDIYESLMQTFFPLEL